MDLGTFDFTQFALAAFVVIGLINGIDMAYRKDWVSFTKFVAAVVAGTVFGILNWFGLPSAEIGLAVGVGSSGVYKTFK